MDFLRLAASTRRRFTLAAGGLALAIAEAPPSPSTGAKNRKGRKGRKRCKRLRSACAPGGKRRCCGRLRCDEVPTQPGFFCCKLPRNPCTSLLECCGNRICSTVDGLTGTFCCGDLNSTPCRVDEDCCSGFGCFEGFCKLK